MEHRHITSFDTATGEQYECIAVRYPKRRNGFKEWLAMNIDAGLALAQMKLQGNDYRVLLVLLSLLDYDNQIALNQTELAKRLDMTRTGVSRSIRHLIDRNIISRSKTPTGVPTLVLNPEIAWRGTALAHREALKPRTRKIGPLTVFDNATGLAYEHQRTTTNNNDAA